MVENRPSGAKSEPVVPSAMNLNYNHMWYMICVVHTKYTYRSLGSAVNENHKPQHRIVDGIPTLSRPTGMVLCKEIKRKGQVATREASAH